MIKKNDKKRSKPVLSVFFSTRILPANVMHFAPY